MKNTAEAATKLTAVRMHRTTSLIAGTQILVRQINSQKCAVVENLEKYEYSNETFIYAQINTF